MLVATQCLHQRSDEPVHVSISYKEGYEEEESARQVDSGRAQCLP